TNQSLNVVIKNGKLLGYNIHTIAGRGKDTLTYRHPVGSAIGISKKRKADVAWLATDSAWEYAYASQEPVGALKDSSPVIDSRKLRKDGNLMNVRRPGLSKWKMEAAVGGGPVLVQDGQIKITNEEELKFYGKAINDKHPRTAMGYTNNGKLIILVVEGRHEKIAEGATLTQLAQIFKDIGCKEALNLDGGGSSCMLVNGKETIRVSDAAGQRPVPAVFEIFYQ
ncbi:MAG TPA: phosphodiester glycosidase family protein, partial [Chitinophagaceae bacterium]|nr:phosphodiester glycosidase family protein [Chitinophagaceae bacterium]